MKLTNCVFSCNKYRIFHFVPSERTDIREYNGTVFKHFNSPSLLLFPCSKNSQQKVFWKVGVLKFFLWILKRRQQRISFFYIVASWRATFLLQRLLKLHVVTNGFGLSPSWQLCRAAISKNTIFSSAASAAASVDYTVDYIIQHHFGFFIRSSTCGNNI